MREVLERIERKIDRLLMEVVGNKALETLDFGSGYAASKPEGGGGGDQEVRLVLRRLSMKQNAALQMIIRGATNIEIADRFGVSVNTAKVYLRSIAKRFGLHLRTQIAVKVAPVIDAMSKAEYLMVSRGLPKHWDRDYHYRRREDDPLWESYTGSRVDEEAGAEGEGETDGDLDLDLEG